MGIYLNPGNEGFKSAIRSRIYIDKTGLLEYTNSVLDTEQRYICVSRPRRFGKSIAAEMLVAYYDKSCNSKELFQGHKIATSQDFMEHLNQYDVLHIDVNYFRGQSMSGMETVENIQSLVIDELRECYPEGVSSTDSRLPVVLSKINNKYGIKFVIIIDEWDAIFRENKNDEKAQKEYIALLRGLFKDAPSKKFLKLGYMTGILPIKKYGTESALNNFDEFTMLNPRNLSEYVGFTQEEVLKLCKEYCMDFEEIKRWYDGYSFCHTKHIYNPNSVVKAMLDGECSNYWTSTETYESLKNYISMNFDGLKDAVIEMIAGGRCKIDTNTFENDMVSFQSRDDVLTILVHLGYLAYNRKTKEVYIPNEEIREAFIHAIKKSNWNYVIEAITASDELLQATWRGDADIVAQKIDKVHKESTSILNYNNENALSCVISLAYYNAINEYIVMRELPTGKGYADIVFLPRKASDKPAMVVELKWNQSEKSAIDQIKEKEYGKILQDYSGKLLLVGINYDKKSKKHNCVIEVCEEFGVGDTQNNVY